MTHDEKFLALCDLGMDKVLLYPYSAKYGLSTNAKEIICPPGSGPRHLTFSACGCYIYVLTELSNTILSYRYNKDDIHLIQEISTLPADYNGFSSAAAIHLSPNGLYVAVSNRGHDSIAIFKITDDGRLIFSNHIKTGKDPRDFRFSPCGKWLLSANQNNDSITIFRIENNTFMQKGIINIPKPVCILFGKNQFVLT
jgi:6-phosphogluconolactonase